MNNRILAVPIVALLSGFAALSACAADVEERPASADLDNKIPSADAATDALTEDVDAGPCEDCEYFPERCTADAFCANELFAASGDFDSRNTVNVLRGRSESDIWMGAAAGVTAHFDGAAWARLDLAERESVQAFWLREDGEVSFATLERPFSHGLPDADGGAPATEWTSRPSPSSPAEYRWWSRLLNSTWAPQSPSSWAWAATEAMACEDFGCRNKPDLRTSGLWRLRQSASGAFEIASVIPPDVCQATSCEGMTGLHGATTNTLWAVGHTGAAIRITDPDGASPILRSFNTQTWLALRAVWAASDADVWAVGTRGIVRHYAGHPVLWDIVSNVPTTEDLNAVWGSSASDVWAVGNAGVILHYDGTTWARVKIAGLGARRPKLTAVWTASEGHVWVGGQGVVLSLGGKP